MRTAEELEPVMVQESYTREVRLQFIRRIQADAIRWCTDKEVLHMRLKAEELDPKDSGKTSITDKGTIRVD